MSQEQKPDKKSKAKKSPAENALGQALVKTKGKNEGTTMAKLLKEKTALFKTPQIGEIIEGKVLRIGKNEMEVDVEGIGVGIIRGPELYQNPDEELKIGDKILATILEIENEKDKMELSSKKASHDSAWQEINRIIEEDETIEAKITQANKGGLLAQIKGIPAFLPVSQLHHEHYPRVEDGDRNKILTKLNQLVNQILKVKIIDANSEEDRLIISEKQAASEAQKGIIDKLKVGDVVEGEITGVVNFGAFMRFDNLEGLIHISELAWQRIENPADIIKAGNRVKAKIISIDANRISLSLKALQDDPWQKKIKKYKVGDVVEGEITKLSPFGAFIQLDADIHGLAHISEITDDPSRLEAVLAIGDKRKFKILSIEPKEHRLGLSLKALEEKTAAPKEKKEKPVKKTTKKAKVKKSK